MERFAVHPASDALRFQDRVREYEAQLEQLQGARRVERRKSDRLENEGVQAQRQLK